MAVIIDRRFQNGNKNLPDAERFRGRTKQHIERAMRKIIGESNIKDVGTGGTTTVPIPSDEIDEPQFIYDAKNPGPRVHPGNERFHAGDKIPTGDQSDSDGSGGGAEDGIDEFRFVVSREEFLKLFFDDLELPDLARKAIGSITEKQRERRGISSAGPMNRLDLTRTMRKAIGRSVVQGRSELTRELAAIETRLTQQIDASEKTQLETRGLEITKRLKRIPFIDDNDLRFRRFEEIQKPIAKAVMFCLMDVSASMDEARKDLAKRFFILLYLFLERKYEKVELRFLRHTESAQEVDEEEFFNGIKNGGTVVLPVLELTRKIIDDHYPLSEWNIYIAQATDGDAFGADPKRSAHFILNDLLPIVQYFAYIETNTDGGITELAKAYSKLSSKLNFAMQRIKERGQIWKVFRKLFEKKVRS